MKILAVDTSSFPASAAVSEDGVILGEYIIRNQRKHSQNILPMTEALFDMLDMNISEIDAFAVTVGPGSFTGLRIGISTVRAFAQATGKPVVGINTLEALSYNLACTKGVIMPLIDARRNEVYCAAYSFDNGEMSELLSPCVMTVEECAELFLDGNVTFTGDGSIANGDYLKSLQGDVSTAPANLNEVRASSVAALAELKLKNGEAVNYNEIEPLYLRKSQAEREYENRRNKE